MDKFYLCLCILVSTRHNFLNDGVTNPINILMTALIFRFMTATKLNINDQETITGLVCMENIASVYERGRLRVDVAKDYMLC